MQGNGTVLGGPVFLLSGRRCLPPGPQPVRQNIMTPETLPLTRDVVLIGGGHTHALVLRRWAMSPLPGARLTLINPGPTAPYSGMLPGHVAGHYERADLDIDLVRLAQFAGARLVLGAAESIDRAERTIRVSGRPPVAYDIASIDIGITSNMPEMAGFADHAIPAKPLGPFAARWQAFLNGTGPARVAVIGAGIAGAELAMAMAHALRGRVGAVTLIERGEALPGINAAARARLRSHLTGQGVVLRENAAILRVTDRGVDLASGESIDADFVTGAAGARPYEWLGKTGLDLKEGFVRVGPTLQSSDPAIFAVGDCAHLDHAPRPKAGVFAVREAPVLFHNLQAAAAGEPMRRYRPQRDYLKLISLGGRAALAERFGLALSGPVMWQWKNRIDQAFMEKFRHLPARPRDPLPLWRAQGVSDALGDKPMCGGCGAKVGRGTLSRIAGDLDDAARLEGGRVLSHDHLRAFWEDPVVMTRIAAIHALGDIWAMGAEPRAVLATLVLPRLSAELQRRTMEEIMAAAHEVVAAAGGHIAGGHSSTGAELTVGFSVEGVLPDGATAIGLSGARPGDALLLTKPIGSGAIMAAHMQRKARGEWVAGALDHMLVPQSGAARLLRDSAGAMTDVTGFGLAGHLMNICEASGCAAVIDLEAVPLMEGAEELSSEGIRSTLWPENRAIAPHLPQGPRADLMFDPQTAGGLLAAVPAAEAEALCRDLQASGVPAARIGVMTEGAPGLRFA